MQAHAQRRFAVKLTQCTGDNGAHGIRIGRRIANNTAYRLKSRDNGLFLDLSCCIAHVLLQLLQYTTRQRRMLGKRGINALTLRLPGRPDVSLCGFHCLTRGQRHLLGGIRHAFTLSTFVAFGIAARGKIDSLWHMLPGRWLWRGGGSRCTRVGMRRRLRRPVRTTPASDRTRDRFHGDRLQNA